MPSKLRVGPLASGVCCPVAVSVASNPLAVFVRAYRDRLLSYRIPSLHDLLIVAAYGVTVFVLGGLFFRHLKRGFADVL